VGSNARPLWAQSVCHDGNWDDGEFCGRDAWLVTGKAEMNHDCRVDPLDLRLFAGEWALVGSNLSADINGDGVVGLTDFLQFSGSFGSSVSPCRRSGMPPEGCLGTIALSFSSNPATIVSTQTQSPSQDRVYVVIDGWTGAEMIEYAVVTSSNVSILSHPPTGYPHWQQADLQIACDPDAQHSWRSFVSTTGSWPSGPIIYNHLDYSLSDSNPAWIKLAPVPSCWTNSRIRWAVGKSNRSLDFATVLNAGINGPAPAGESTCWLKVPALDPPMLWVLVSALVAVAVFVLGRRWRAHA
jgi:hypothetical protein